MISVANIPLGKRGVIRYIPDFRNQGVIMATIDTAAVVRLRGEGRGIKEIARILKCRTGTIVQVLRDQGALGQPYFLTPDERAMVKKLRLEGHPAEVIANSLGRSTAAITEHLRRLKLQRRIIRPITVKGDVAEIELTRGYVALIDAADVSLVQGRSWFASGAEPKIYPATRENGVPLTLHRFLMNQPEGLHVDHINGNGLDNRRCNLRLATAQQNMANARRKVGRAGFHGVAPTKTGKFFATIQINLGTFDTAEEAARAYDAKAIELFGEFALTNAKRGLFDKEEAK